MPAPLIWLGAAALSAYAANKANSAYLKRENIVDALPGDSLYSSAPKNGSIVACGIYGVLDHTGIWVDGNIYELAGNGLVRCVSPQRFLGDRSGNKIYIAANQSNRAYANKAAAEKARSLLYSLLDYHLLNQNCHKFVAEVLLGSSADITSFSDLNVFLSEFFKGPIRWNLIEINKL